MMDNPVHGFRSSAPKMFGLGSYFSRAFNNNCLAHIFNINKYNKRRCKLPLIKSFEIDIRTIFRNLIPINGSRKMHEFVAKIPLWIIQVGTSKISTFLYFLKLY